METTNFMQTLYVIRAIIRGTPGNTSEELCAHFRISDRTLKRHIAEARQLGADIKACRVDGRWIWECQNSDELKKGGKLDRWIELEESRSLL